MSRISRRLSTLAFLGALAGFTIPPAAAAEYRPGGPLAGLTLPLYPTKHGEPAGYPGSIAELAAAAKAEKPESTEFTPQGQFPKEHLHEGSVEHWSAYWAHYLPVRTMFDRQSLLKNWRATELPEARGRIEEYAEPVYWIPRHGTSRDTGRRNPPVPVVRAGVEGPVFTLDCGELAPGLYVLRAVGAVEPAKIQRHRLPLIMTMTVNDGVQGESTTYRMRFPYVDEFYSVAEFYFHAPERRRYQATLAVEAGSMVDLLVYNLDLHDVMAGCEVRPLKARRTLTAAREVAVEAIPNTDELLEREKALWNQFPPLNSHTRFTYGMGGDDSKSNWPNIGAGGKTPEEIAQEFGTWNWQRAQGDVLAINQQLDLVYTLDDYRAGKPLPDPYPFKDRGMGVFTPAANDGETPQNFWPVPEALGRKMRGYAGAIDGLVKRYMDRGDVDAGREAAFRLVRVAYNIPAIEARQSPHCFLVQPGPYGRDLGSRRRASQMGAEIGSMELCQPYDALFDLIRADAGLAESVGRFIPWVKTPGDVIALLDAYIVQTTAKRIMRYYIYSSNTPQMILTPVNTLGDNEFTRPWMEWLFSAAFIYPFPPAGIQDLVATANDRNGLGYIASTFYNQGQHAATIASYLDDYIAMGGLAEFNLGDPTRFPKPMAACHWFYDVQTAGGWFLPIGDVCGPDKGFGHAVTKVVPQGWKWSRDPKFAWGILHHGDRAKYSDQEWDEIAAAAATVERAPWLENRSRVISNWAGILETGLEFDDLRYRRSVMLRTGSGWGHHHHDGLDLQIKTLGYSITIDAGQRPGYGRPPDRASVTHNVATVDDREWLGHTWVNTLSDVEDARYLRAEAEPPANHPDVRLFSRQVALIDVDEGAATGGEVPADRRFDKDDPPANSYVFDVQRIAGGRIHTHGFHAMIEDDMECNAIDRISHEALPEADRVLADRFPRNIEEYARSQDAFAGRAPNVLETTWRMTRAAQGIARTEQSQNEAIWNPASPRKYLRMHLLGQQGERVISGWNHCRQWNYGWTAIHTRRQAEEDLESVFPAILEPFEGEPIIVGRRLLDVADNDSDALRAVAVEVQTVRGATDVLFADGRPETTRQVGGLTISAEFAHVSADATGLRTAAITGGTLLDHPLVRMAPVASERRAVIRNADYAARRFTVDAAWDGAELLAGRVFEVGVPGRMTTFTVANAARTADGTVVTVTEGAQFFLCRVSQVDAENRTIVCGLGFTQNEKKPLPGLDKHWVAATEDGTRFWRAEYLGDVEGINRYQFKLDGPVTAADFAGNKGFTLWEYGVGDTVRISTFAGMRRVEQGVYELTADTALELELTATSAEISRDRATWAPLAGTRKGNRLAVSLDHGQLADGRVFIRVR